MFTPKKQHLWFVSFIAVLAVSGLLLVSGQAQGAEKPSTTFADSPLEPLQIVTLSGSPQPLIGQVATIHVEVLSKYDTVDASIGVDLPDGVELVEGELVWQGTLMANQIQVHELSVRVQTEGHWRLWVSASSKLTDQRTFGDGETLHLITTIDSAKFIRGRDYRVVIPPEGMPIPEIPAEEVIVVTSAPTILGQVTIEGAYKF